MEELSRKILAPQGAEGYRETKWFYERARGQYADERGRRTPAERKKFDEEFPRSQFFTKTDLAKYENTWACAPHIVSLGAQKNFGEFAKTIGKIWGKDGASFREIWFKRLVAKGILFKTMEKLVSGSSWYEGGYRANIVTHGIAKVVHDADKLGLTVDLDRIWLLQSVPQDLLAALELAGEEAQAVITDSDEGLRNPSEWAKQQGCWAVLSKRQLSYSDAFKGILISPELATEEETASGREGDLEAGLQDYVEVFNLGGDFWAEAAMWGKDHKLLSPKQNGVLQTCSAIPRKAPSQEQCRIAMETLRNLRSEGFKSSLEVV
jgi:hypothetical protein